MALDVFEMTHKTDDHNQGENAEMDTENLEARHLRIVVFSLIEKSGEKLRLAIEPSLDAARKGSDGKHEAVAERCYFFHVSDVFVAIRQKIAASLRCYNTSDDPKRELTYSETAAKRGYHNPSSVVEVVSVHLYCSVGKHSSR